MTDKNGETREIDIYPMNGAFLIKKCYKRRNIFDFLFIFSCKRAQCVKFYFFTACV